MKRHCLPGLCAGLVFLAGCLHPVSQKIDGVVCDLMTLPRDPQPLAHGETPLQPASYQKVEPDKPDKTEPPPPKSQLTVPEDLLPGGPVPPITLPPLTPETEAARKKAIEQLYPLLPELGADL